MKQSGPRDVLTCQEPAFFYPTEVFTRDMIVHFMHIFTFLLMMLSRPQPTQHRIIG
jgi:hypothetical protein